jgi:uncharacterized protein (DUF736 family)
MTQREIHNNPGYGVLFIVFGAERRGAPNYSGGVNIDGREYQLAGWRKISKAGKEYISLNIRPKQEDL